MSKKLLIIIILLLFSSAYSKTANQIIAISEKMMRGNTSTGRMEMIIQTPKWKRSVKMTSWARGTKKSFIRIDYPKRDKGITFLKRGNEMWQYIPKIEKTIKIPPSMMMQSWMGSDFTNDDLVKESSLANDYTSKIIKRDKVNYTLELIPKPESAVVWGKLIMVINKKSFLPVKVEYYAEDGELINILEYSNVKKFNDRFYPTKWVMLPQTEDKKGHSTTLIVISNRFNIPISNSVFTLRSLRTRSR